MDVKIYIGSHIDPLEDTAATAYIIQNAASRAVLAINVQAAKPDRRSIELQAIRAAVKALAYVHGVTDACICSDSSQAVSWLRGAAAPKGLRGLAADIQRRVDALPCQVRYQCVCSDTVAVAAQLAEIGRLTRGSPAPVPMPELIFSGEF